MSQLHMFVCRSSNHIGFVLLLPQEWASKRLARAGATSKVPAPWWQETYIIDNKLVLYKMGIEGWLCSRQRSKFGIALPAKAEHILPLPAASQKRGYDGQTQPHIRSMCSWVEVLHRVKFFRIREKLPLLTVSARSNSHFHI